MQMSRNDVRAEANGMLYMSNRPAPPSEHLRRHSMTNAAAPAPRRLAVTFIHGVQITDPDFADRASNLLRQYFAERGVDPDDALVIQPTSWAEELQEEQDRLFTGSFGPWSGEYMNRLNRLATAVNAGHDLALLPLAASALVRRIPGAGILQRVAGTQLNRLPGLAELLRWLPWGGQLNYPTLRWLVVQFLGDAVSYQSTNDDHELYDRIHARLADSLRKLAEQAGDDAPLCVIAHSLGTVIASNYFYDLQNGGPELTSIGDAVKHRIVDNPLARGETLAFFYTLGSPLALWASRFGSAGTPIAVPAPQLGNHHKGLAGTWVNVVDRDDPVAYPLRPLGEQYRRQVHEDKIMRVGPRWFSWSPLVHTAYWNDRKVIDGVIAPPLFDAWCTLNPTLTPQA